jgi:hypothetical protein
MRAREALTPPHRAALLHSHCLRPYPRSAFISIATVARTLAYISIARGIFLSCRMITVYHAQRVCSCRAPRMPAVSYLLLFLWVIIAVMHPPSCRLVLFLPCRVGCRLAPFGYSRFPLPHSVALTAVSTFFCAPRPSSASSYRFLFSFFLAVGFYAFLQLLLLLLLCGPWAERPWLPLAFVGRCCSSAFFLDLLSAVNNSYCRTPLACFLSTGGV